MRNKQGILKASLNIKKAKVTLLFQKKKLRILLMPKVVLELSFTTEKVTGNIRN